MSTSLSTAIFTLFGSRVQISFNKKNSVFENFISMCSLPWIKCDSEATIRLKQVIKKNNFIFEVNDNCLFDDDYVRRDEQVRGYINNINTVKSAIDEWRTQRYGFSSRVALMDSFKTRLTDFGNSLSRYLQDFQYSRTSGLYS